VYGKNIGLMGDAATRRVWRVFTLADPELELDPFTDALGNTGYGKDGSKPYPFSVAPASPVSLQDVMAMARCGRLCMFLANAIHQLTTTPPTPPAAAAAAAAASFLVGDCRDNYEGTPFSMMEGTDSGPFGDVIRSSPNSIVTVCMSSSPCDLTIAHLHL
jgi:hypothetical protein